MNPTGLLNGLLIMLLLCMLIIALYGCAGPFNQVQPCLLNCAVTLNGSPATAPQPATWSNRPSERVVVEPPPH